MDYTPLKDCKELSENTLQLALALDDYDFDDNRRITLEDVPCIIKDAVGRALFTLDDEIADDCVDKIFRGAVEVHR